MTLRDLINGTNIMQILISVGDCACENFDAAFVEDILRKFVQIAENAGIVEYDVEPPPSDSTLLLTILKELRNLSNTVVTQAQLDADIANLVSAVQSLQATDAQQNDIIAQQNTYIQLLISSFNSLKAQNANLGLPLNLASEDATVQQITTQIANTNNALQTVNGAISTSNQQISAALAQVQTTGSSAVAAAGNSGASGTATTSSTPSATTTSSNASNVADGSSTPEGTASSSNSTSEGTASTSAAS